MIWHAGFDFEPVTRKVKLGAPLTLVLQVVYNGASGAFARIALHEIVVFERSFCIFKLVFAIK